MSSIRLLDLEETYVLRRDVLRDGYSDGIQANTDLLSETFHVGAVNGERVIATATFLPATYEASDIEPAYQLRYMAVDEAFQGQGLGHAVLERGIEILAERGVRLLWANARDTALDFYVKEGFEVVEGSQFVHPAVGMPHTVVLRRI